MNVSLTPELEKFIENQVISQRYQTASEVVREAVRLLQRSAEQEMANLESLRRDIRHAAERSERGEFVDVWTPEEKKVFMAGILERGRERLARKQRRRSA